MNIGDKVRFLHETGGGIVKAFKGKDTVLVEGEDGFQLPMSIRECVVIDTNEYNFVKKSVPPKPDASSSKINNSVSRNNDIKEPDTQITFRPKERVEGEKLNITLAFLPIDEKSLNNSRFEAYLINESNYFLYFTYLSASGASWSMREKGLIEPDSKCFLEEFGREDLNDMEKICVQFLPFKDNKPFAIKQALNVELRLDMVKFYKLHLFRENNFFEENALLYPLVIDDVPKKEIFVDSKEIMAHLHQKIAADTALEPKQQRIPKQDNILEVDLHINSLLDNTVGMNNFDILNYQLDVVRKTLNEYIKEKGKRIVFIHGKGEGVLRNAISQELRKKFPRCASQDASFQKYGFGATMVIIH